MMRMLALTVSPAVLRWSSRTSVASETGRVRLQTRSVRLGAVGMTAAAADGGRALGRRRKRAKLAGEDCTWDAAVAFYAGERGAMALPSACALSNRRLLRREGDAAATCSPATRQHLHIRAKLTAVGCHPVPGTRCVFWRRCRDRS